MNEAVIAYLQAHWDEEHWQSLEGDYDHCPTILSTYFLITRKSLLDSITCGLLQVSSYLLWKNIGKSMFMAISCLESSKTSNGSRMTLIRTLNKIGKQLRGRREVTFSKAISWVHERLHSDPTNANLASKEKTTTAANRIVHANLTSFLHQTAKMQ